MDETTPPIFKSSEMINEPSLISAEGNNSDFAQNFAHTNDLMDTSVCNNFTEQIEKNANSSHANNVDDSHSAMNNTTVSDNTSVSYTNTLTSVTAQKSLNELNHTENDMLNFSEDGFDAIQNEAPKLIEFVTTPTTVRLPETNSDLNLASHQDLEEERKKDEATRTDLLLHDAEEPLKSNEVQSVTDLIQNNENEINSLNDADVAPKGTGKNSQELPPPPPVQPTKQLLSSITITRITREKPNDENLPTTVAACKNSADLTNSEIHEDDLDEANTYNDPSAENIPEGSARCFSDFTENHQSTSSDCMTIHTQVIKIKTIRVKVIQNVFQDYNIKTRAKMGAMKLEDPIIEEEVLSIETETLEKEIYKSIENNQIAVDEASECTSRPIRKPSSSSKTDNFDSKQKKFQKRKNSETNKESTNGSKRAKNYDTEDHRVIIIDSDESNENLKAPSQKKLKIKKAEKPTPLSFKKKASPEIDLSENDKNSEILKTPITITSISNELRTTRSANKSNSSRSPERRKPRNNSESTSRNNDSKKQGDVLSVSSAISVSPSDSESLGSFAVSEPKSSSKSPANTKTSILAPLNSSKTKQNPEFNFNKIKIDLGTKATQKLLPSNKSPINLNVQTQTKLAACKELVVNITRLPGVKYLSDLRRNDQNDSDSSSRPVTPLPQKKSPLKTVPDQYQIKACTVSLKRYNK